jgi:hypothetical protein
MTPETQAKITAIGAKAKETSQAALKWAQEHPTEALQIADATKDAHGALVHAKDVALQNGYAVKNENGEVTPIAKGQEPQEPSKVASMGAALSNVSQKLGLLAGALDGVGIGFEEFLAPAQAIVGVTEALGKGMQGDWHAALSTLLARETSALIDAIPFAGTIDNAAAIFNNGQSLSASLLKGAFGSTEVGAREAEEKAEAAKASASEQLNNVKGKDGESVAAVSDKPKTIEIDGQQLSQDQVRAAMAAMNGMVIQEKTDKMPTQAEIIALMQGKTSGPSDVKLNGAVPEDLRSTRAPAREVDNSQVVVR